MTTLYYYYCRLSHSKNDHPRCILFMSSGWSVNEYNILHTHTGPYLENYRLWANNNCLTLPKKTVVDLFFLINFFTRPFINTFCNNLLITHNKFLIKVLYIHIFGWFLRWNIRSIIFRPPTLRFETFLFPQLIMNIHCI